MSQRRIERLSNATRTFAEPEDARPPR